jgi:hypothetical protein
MYALARHWVRGAGFAAPLHMEPDLLSEAGAQVGSCCSGCPASAAAAAAAGDRDCFYCVQEIMSVIEDKRKQLLSICRKRPMTSEEERHAT